MQKEKISLFYLISFIQGLIFTLVAILAVGAIIFGLVFEEGEITDILLLVFGGIAIAGLFLFGALDRFALATKCLIIEDEGVIIKNIFSNICSFRWEEIKDIYMIEFPDAKKYKVPNSLFRTIRRGTRAEIHNRFKYPGKWIVIDNGRQSPFHIRNCNNKLRFLLAHMTVNSVIKFEYKEKYADIMKNIFKKYSARTGELKVISKRTFYVTNQLKSYKENQLFYIFLHDVNRCEIVDMHNEKIEDWEKKDFNAFVLEPLHQYILPEYHHIWLERKKKREEKKRDIRELQ